MHPSFMSNFTNIWGTIYDTGLLGLELGCWFLPTAAVLPGNTSFVCCAFGFLVFQKQKKR
jgi:hypothetical protein